ncbi:metallophosphoesterase family protein [Actinomadura livida]|uniref:Metallophosphoesterase n=1 Tax=Actinomadura livida TaxID=79909 RepID=A0A7W7I927_9ACTN|nr:MULTISPECIES: metallophosphoesterase [Actinomadura]MBB4772443.1 putative MPP superfamily phosphohydrolase [Actinomadura catellatispora]GGU22927.1 membrane protein [Actinomadura livida]
MPKVRTALTDVLTPLRQRVSRARGALRDRTAPVRDFCSPVTRRVRPAVTGRTSRVLLVMAVGLTAGYAGLLLGGRTVTAVGPTDVQLSLRPSLQGGTTLELPPLGSLQLDTHWGPVSLEASLTDVRPEQAQKLIEDGTELDRLTDRITDQIRDGVATVLVRAALVALLAGFLAGLVVFRSWRRALLGMGSAALGLAGVTLLTWATFNPHSIAEPRYTGLLANAPQIVGDARSIVERFSEYRAQLARLVGNVSELYTTTSTLPTYEPDPSTLRVLHVSDIHLNPAAWNVIKSVTTQFKVDLIIDTGDLMDHGSAAEDRFADDISDLKVPYVYVRGNHDSKGTEDAVDDQKNAVVLDNETREVKGLRIYGVGDPRYTPDKSTRDDFTGADQIRAEGQRLAAELRETGTTPDIVATHDPTEGEAFSGATPLVLAGHAHTRSSRLLPTGTRLFVQGSTGGAGLRGLEHEEPTPIELSVLYFSRATHRLQGWDDLRLGGLGLTSANIERHLEPDPDRTIDPTPPPSSPPPSPTSPFPSEFPSDWPSRSPTPLNTASPARTTEPD